jgi:Fe-S-cluster containining protein
MNVIPIHVQNRINDPETTIGAERRASHMRQRLDALLPRMNYLFDRAEQADNGPQKIRFMRQAADLMGEAAKGVAPCADKCSHCCHIPVLMSQTEADLIGKETATKVTKTKYNLSSNTQYVGVPCPFLKAKRCSIYEYRPMACRVHFTMDRDNLLCELVPGANIKAPYFNNLPIIQQLVKVLGQDEAYRHADLRDFFKG